MKNFEIALRSLFKKGRGNGFKIISLGVGLAMGLVLISKVCFERSFDSFYPDSERIYRVLTNMDQKGELQCYPTVSGGVAPGMKAELPEVEQAVRFSSMGVGGDKALFTTSDKNKYSARNVFLADSNVFDIFSVPILAGNPKDVLARPGYVMVARRLAEKMGGIDKVVGQTFTFDSNPAKGYTIGGVFEDIPENSHLRYEILVSLNELDTWSLNNWNGNDRYFAYVKLHPGFTPEKLKPALLALLERHINVEALRKNGVDMEYILTPLAGMHSETPEVRNMSKMLLLLAFILIASAVLNYILIVLSTLIGRTKEVAVRKCYGSSDSNLLGMIMSETWLHMILALLIAGFLILLFREKVEELLDASLLALFSLRTVILLIAVCMLTGLLTGLIPTYVLLRIPVAAAFRSFKESRRYWKLCLLFVQFGATAYLVAMLSIINAQYNHFINDDPGYKYDKLFYYSVKGIDVTGQESLLQEIAKLPEVEQVSSSFTLPIWGGGGNHIYLPGDTRKLMNVADLYWVNDNFFQLMEIPVTEGEAFGLGGSAADKMMVSRSFADKITNLTGWKDGVVGKSLFVSEHSLDDNHYFVICGVYEDIRLGSIVEKDPELRPTVLFWSKEKASNLLVKLRKVSPENVQKVADVIARMYPDRDATLYSYKADMVNMYQESRSFRDAVLAGGIVTLVIALIGLLGYTSDEINRRGREIAIRKVNGATASDILRMISRGVSYIAVPALIIGSIMAYFSGEEWMQQFRDKIKLDFSLFFYGVLFVYILLVACILYRAWEVANSNPAESIKSE